MARTTRKIDDKDDEDNRWPGQINGQEGSTRKVQCEHESRAMALLQLFFFLILVCLHLPRPMYLDHALGEATSS